MDDEEIAVHGDQDPMMVNIANPLEFCRLLPEEEGGPSLYWSTTRRARPLEDAVDYAFRTIINGELCRRIYDPFHPSLCGIGTDREDDEIFDRLPDVHMHDAAAVLREGRIDRSAGKSDPGQTRPDRQPTLDAMCDLPRRFNFERNRRHFNAVRWSEMREIETVCENDVGMRANPLT